MSALSERLIKSLIQWHSEQYSHPLGPADQILFDDVTKVLVADREKTLDNGSGTPENFLIALVNRTRGVSASSRGPTTGEPLNWQALKERTRKAPKQFELIRILVQSEDWIEFSELAGLVYQDETTPTATIAQLIKRANETLESINARVRIRRDGQRAIADIL